MNQTDSQLAARDTAERGLALLESKGIPADEVSRRVFPHGFEDCAFAMGDPHYCVLARVSGDDYNAGRQLLGIDVDEAIEFGFEVDSSHEFAYWELTEAWADLLLPGEA